MTDPGPTAALYVDRRRTRQLIVSMLVTFLALRGYLHAFPNQDMNIGGFNIHHLFTGLLLVTAGGIPLVVLNGTGRLLDFATIVFGAGLAMALDEWVYLIVTDGSNASYLLPVSLWGGIGFVGAALIYTAWLAKAAQNRSMGPRRSQ